MCTAAATEHNRPGCLTHENVRMFVALREEQIILACYIILRYLIISTQSNLRVNRNFELKKCQNGGTHLKETGNLRRA
jgi:hypothetical protein